jgi:membrane-associated phospholipid phosphatase
MRFIRNHRSLVLLCVFSLFSFILVCVSVVSEDKSLIDTLVYEQRSLFQSETGINFMLAVSEVFDPTVLVILSGILFCILLVQKRYALASILFGSLCFAALSSTALKYIFDIARPVHSFSEIPGQAFPSTHAAVAAVFSVITVSAVYKKVHDVVLNIIFTITMLGMAFAVGFSRIYLSVHWVSDVVAGFSLGIFIATLGLLLYARIHHHYHGTYPNHS